MPLLARSRFAPTLALTVALLGMAGCHSPCPVETPPQRDAKDHVRLETEVISDHHILWVHNDHESETIRATTVWVWTPKGERPQAKSSTDVIDAGGRVQPAFYYGKGTLSGETVKSAEYKKDD